MQINRANRTKAGIAALVTGALVACGSFALASEGAVTGAADSSAGEGVEAAEQQGESGTASTVSAEDIQGWCGACHFASIENASIASWNQTNVDAAMVESMVPMLDDETIQAIADYFAQIEPPAADEGQGTGQGANQDAGGQGADQSEGGQH